MLNFQKKAEYWKFNPYASVQKWWALIATYTIHLISRFRCSKLVISIYQFGDEVSLIECSWWIENEGVCNSQKDIKQDNKQVWSEKRLPSHRLLQFCRLSAFFLARALFYTSSWAHLCFTKSGSIQHNLFSWSRSFALAAIGLAIWKDL